MSTKVSLYIITAKEEDSLYFFVETDNQLQPRWVFFFSCCRPTKSAMLAFYPYTQKVLDSLFFFLLHLGILDTLGVRILPFVFDFGVR